MASSERITTALISYDELCAAIEKVWHTFNTDKWATEIVEHALANRFIPGEIYEDGAGKRLLRRDDDLWPWQVITGASASTSAHVNEEYAVRPIHKLVPEAHSVVR